MRASRRASACLITETGRRRPNVEEGKLDSAVVESLRLTAPETHTSKSFAIGKLFADTTELIIQGQKPIQSADLFADAFGSQQVAYVSMRSDNTQCYAARCKAEV
jgi:hypothetical protein